MTTFLVRDVPRAHRPKAELWRGRVLTDGPISQKAKGPAMALRVGSSPLRSQRPTSDHFHRCFAISRGLTLGFEIFSFGACFRMASATTFGP